MFLDLNVFLLKTKDPRMWDTKGHKTHAITVRHITRRQLPLPWCGSLNILRLDVTKIFKRNLLEHDLLHFIIQIHLNQTYKI